MRKKEIIRIKTKINKTASSTLCSTVPAASHYIQRLHIFAFHLPIITFAEAARVVAPIPLLFSGVGFTKYNSFLMKMAAHLYLRLEQLSRDNRTRIASLSLDSFRIEFVARRTLNIITFAGCYGARPFNTFSLPYEKANVTKTL